MENNTEFHFELTMFLNIGIFKYPAFVFCLVLYVFIVFANLVIIVVTVREKTLHAPMYIFVGCLCVNSLYGSTCFFPRFLLDLLSDTHLISNVACFTQIYFLYTYACNEQTLLSVMAYDRYVAVCKPLHYHSIMNTKTVFKLVLFAILCPAFSLCICLCLTANLPLCGNKIHKVFCANWNVVKLSCTPTAISSVVGVLLSIVSGFLPFCFVLYTYLRILIVCWGSSSEYKGKALNSCLPHIISYAVYSIIGFSDIALTRSNLEAIHSELAVILSVQFVVIPPVLNPLVYGLKLPEIRRQIEKLFVTLVTQTIHTGIKT